MSTRALIGLRPMARRRFCIHSGDGPLLTPRTSLQRESRAEMRVGGREVEMDRGRAVERALEGLGLRRLQRAEAGRGEVARDAGDARRVGAVRGQRDVDDGIVEPGEARVRRADRRVVGQLHDAVVVVAELELGGRAQHAVRLDAADDALGERDLLAGNIGPDRREHALHPGARVRRAADDLNRARAGFDDADPQPVGVGMRLGLDDVADDEAGVLGARVLDALDLEADAGQRVDDLGERGLRVEMVLEPGEGEFHVEGSFPGSGDEAHGEFQSRVLIEPVEDCDGLLGGPRSTLERFLSGEG